MTNEREERIINRLKELATLLNADFTKYETKNSRGEETTKYVITIATSNLHESKTTSV